MSDQHPTRSELNIHLDEISRRFISLEDKYMSIERDTKRISETVVSMENDTRKIREIVETWNNAKGFVNVVRSISTSLKILTPIALAIAAVLYFMSHGSWPK